jgi:hypothetical protein
MRIRVNLPRGFPLKASNRKDAMELLISRKILHSYFNKLERCTGLQPEER